MNKISLESNFQKHLSLLFLVGALTFSFFIPDSLAESDSPVSRIKQIAAAEKSGNIFILNGDNSVTVYDVEKKEFFVSSSKAVPRQTDFLVASPSGEYFAGVAMNEFNLQVYVYNTKSYLSSPEGALTADSFYNFSRKGRGSRALGLFSPNEKVFYLADSLAGKVFVADLAQKKISEINIGGTVAALESDSSGKLLFALTHNPDQLVVVNGPTRSIVNKYDVGAMADNILYNQTLNRVYVSERGIDRVSIIDLASKKVRRLPIGKSPISMSYDKANGNVFVGSNDDGSIYRISPEFTIKKIALGIPAYASYPINLWYSQSAKKIVALNPSARKLYFVDPGSLQILKEKDISGWAKAILGGEDVSLAAVHRSNSNDIVVVDAETFDISYLPQSNEKASAIFSSPQGVVVDTRSQRIYVGNLGSGEIAVIDGKTMKVIAKIPVGAAPNVLYLNQNLNKLYVTDSVDNIITAIDISRSDFPLKVVPIEGMPRTISGNDLTNLIYVSLAQAKKVVVIDGASDKVIKEIPLDEKSVFPLLLTTNDKKNEVYVADYGANFISVLDGTENTVKKTITVGNKPIWVAYFPAIDKIYVAVEGNKRIVVIDPSAYEILNAFQINASPYRILFDYKTKLTYVTHRNETMVTVLRNDESGARILKEIEMPFLGQLDAISYNMIYADTRRIDENTDKVYVTSQRLNNLTVTKLVRDSEGIMQFVLYAVMDSEGNVSLSDAARKEMEEKAVVSPGLPRWVVPFILIVMLISIVAAVFLWKRKSNGITPVGGV